MPLRMPRAAGELQVHFVPIGSGDPAPTVVFVEDIGRMVDEFSSFARMPRPELKPENLCELVRQAVFLERNRFPDIRIELTAPEQPLPLLCDARLVSQALINVLKNAAEAVHGRDADATVAGWIGVVVRSDDASRIAVVVEDNGRGLPRENRDRLTEPYVTTRVKGTGLGLAIVKKIMEDHNGDLLLEDREGGGARVSLVFSEVQAQTRVPKDGQTAPRDEMRPSFSVRMHVNG